MNNNRRKFLEYYYLSIQPSSIFIYICYYYYNKPEVLICPTPSQLPLHCRSTPPSGCRINRSSNKIIIMPSYLKKNQFLDLEQINDILLTWEDYMSTCVCVRPVFVCVQCQSSDLSPVFRQLSVTHHGHHADDVDDRVLGAHPHLVLVNSQHAILRQE